MFFICCLCFLCFFYFSPFPPLRSVSNVRQLILPFTIGVYCLIAHQYALDPIMGLVGISEYTLMEFYAIREPYVRRLLIKRSAGILVLTVAIGPCSPPPPVLPCFRSRVAWP